MKALLRLNRLRITRNAHILYDQKFHDGVNIIHGSNGSGKSTIADFIFFVLGGDLKKWREHASLATHVFGEFICGGSTLSLQRLVSTDSARPMSIFMGNLDTGLDSGPDSWRILPYRRPDIGLSFSQVLFRAIGIPDAISDGSSNITMHQMLRLLYSDQLTPIQRIFREDTFDPWQIRQAIGDLMCGLGGYDLYDKQIRLREVEKQYSDIVGRLRSLQVVASSFGKDILPEHISVAISNTMSDRQQLLTKAEDLLASDVTKEILDEAASTRASVKRELSRARNEAADLEDRIESLEFEIADSHEFIGYLEKTLEDFGDASVTFRSFGSVRFEYCPSCFAPAEHDDGCSCSLCGKDIVDLQDDGKTLAVRLDLEMQLQESRRLQVDRAEQLSKAKSALRAARLAANRLASSDQMMRRSDATAVDVSLSAIYRKIGFFDREIQSLEQRLEVAVELQQLTDQKENLNVEISKLKGSIEALGTQQARRKQRAYTLISSLAKRVLQSDLAEHNDFPELDTVSFNFADDWIAVNGDKNRAGSASGMVVLKNSFMFSLFLASLYDSEFELPRFMILDNIEDKGMVQERAWQFQRNIISFTEEAKTEGQIIFMTSKIAPELAGSKYVVGRAYTAKSKTLNLLG